MSDDRSMDASHGADDDKRALSDLAPPTTRAGDDALSALAFDALSVAAREPWDTLTHGFHSYPARMHPAIARQVLVRHARPGMLVLDPFCGGGTTLIEARVRRHRSMGVDLNPLALRLARAKTTHKDEAAIEALRTQIIHIAQGSKERVRRRELASAPVSPAEAKRYSPHVLKELAGLLAEIDKVPDEDDRRLCELVLTATLPKVSLRRSETDTRTVDRTIGRFIPSDLYQRKGLELCDRLDRLRLALSSAPQVELFCGDMRQVKLPHAADLIITSPPYGGTYDYATHHDGRIEWLGLSDKKLERHELGARRHMAQASRDDWDQEVLGMLAAFCRALKPEAHAFVVMGDAEIGGERVGVLPQFDRLAKRHGLTVVASASAPRRDWSGRSERQEHVVVLQRASTT